MVRGAISMMFNIPVSARKADRLIRLLDLAEGSRVFDAGCGEGEFLVRVMEMTGAAGVGVDVDAQSIAAARSKAEARVPPGGWEFREWDLQKEVLEEAAFDVAICLGSTHAFGSGEAAYPNTIARLSRAVRPGGQVLIGEGYWRTTPVPEYLELIGEPVGIYRDHEVNVSFGEQQGLVPLYAATSNEDEWDHFEWTHRMRIEQESMLRPDDAEIAEKRRRSRAWRDGYLRWGRSTMGFGFYLFMKPG
jgi:SAM-dependent methyltransferase